MQNKPSPIWAQQIEYIKKKSANILNSQGKEFTQRSFASFLDVSYGKVQAWERGQRPHADDLEKMSRILNLSPEWLLMGEGEPERMGIRRLGANAPTDPACVVGPGGEGPVGRVVEVHSASGAGPAVERWEPEPIARVCIPLTYYRESVLIVQVEGSSMEPDIRKGAFVGLDTAQTRIIAGESYGVRVPYEGLTIKRVFVDPGGPSLVLKSVNPSHPDVRLPFDGRDDLIVGRAVWVMQKL
ncbi:XRE family transcriptional regulator [Desulfovibrio aminophilus]|uniref:XRE family transcriptional regulator n=1 Tax=Desulfovibrio aminophilus TaxID=81425 RepID=UPI000A0564F1|nr:S24 family peptidase [Desulfovibrio aminophilus]